MIVNFQGNALGSETPCATCKGVPERWRNCVICAYARYDYAVLYERVSDAEALARFVHWRQLAGLTQEQAPLPAPVLPFDEPTEAVPAPHPTRRASTPAGADNGSETRTPWGKCRGCGWVHPLILGVIEPHTFNGVSCIGVGKSPATE